MESSRDVELLVVAAVVGLLPAGRASVEKVASLQATWLIFILGHYPDLHL